MRTPGFDLSWHMGKLQGLYDAMGQCGKLPAGHAAVTGIRVAIERQHAMLRQELADEEYNVGIVNGNVTVISAY
jgi:hypothetical protein